MKFSYQRNKLRFKNCYSKRVFKIFLIIFNAVFNNKRKKNYFNDNYQKRQQLVVLKHLKIWLEYQNKEKYFLRIFSKKLF